MGHSAHSKVCADEKEVAVYEHAVVRRVSAADLILPKWTERARWANGRRRKRPSLHSHWKVPERKCRDDLRPVILASEKLRFHHATQSYKKPFRLPNQPHQPTDQRVPKSDDRLESPPPLPKRYRRRQCFFRAIQPNIDGSEKVRERRESLLRNDPRRDRSVLQTAVLGSTRHKHPTAAESSDFDSSERRPLHIHAMPLLAPVQERDPGIGRALPKRAQQYSAETVYGITQYKVRV